MKEPDSSAQIDPLLSPFLHAADKEEEQEHLQQVLKQVADILKKITSDDDERQEALRQLIVALRNCKSDPDNNPIYNFKYYAAKVGKHVCQGQKRAERPEFTTLKEELRRLLHANPRFAIWRSNLGKSLCGLAEWSDLTSPPTRSDRLTRLSNDPLGCEDEVLDNRNARLMKNEELVESLCQWLGHPFTLDELTEIVFVLKRILPFVVVPEFPLDDEHEHASREIARDKKPQPDVETEHRELLRLLWSEIEQLPHHQRIALLLNFTPADGQLELFVFHGIAGIRRIGRTLGLNDEHYARWRSSSPAEKTMPTEDDEKFASLWNALPLDDLTIAEMLSTTRQNIINLRSSALKRIRRRTAAWK